MLPPVDFNLYLITDRNACAGRPLVAIVEEALKGGVRAIQLREKDLAGRELYELACAMREVTSRYGARLFINDRADIALAVKADGVHLGERSLAPPCVRQVVGRELLIGVSCHSPAGAMAAQDGGADFITYGPVFPTPSKAAYGPPLGIASLEGVARKLRIPAFGLGGIKENNAREVLRAGAHGIAMISAIIAAPDPQEEARRLLALIADNEARQGRDQ